MLSVVALAPDFQARDQHGQMRSLADLLSPGRLALYFYPRDFTPICTAQACLFRDAAEELSKLGVNVAGVSPDVTDTHARFGAKHSVKFPLLADSDQHITRLYEARWPLIGSTKRITYLITKDRRVLSASHHELFAAKHLMDLRALLASR